MAEMASILWVDDVWITGILRSKAGIDHLNTWTKWYTPYVEHLKVNAFKSADFNKPDTEFTCF